MKRQFALLLTSVLLVFALTACGGDDKDASHSTGEQNTAGDSIQDAGDNIADAGQDILDAGEDILDPNDHNGTDNGTDRNDADRDNADLRDDSALTDGSTATEGTATKQSGRVGVSYGQMLRNARVHDTDGFLKDGENAVSPGAP